MTGRSISEEPFQAKRLLRIIGLKVIGPAVSGIGGALANSGDLDFAVFLDRPGETELRRGDLITLLLLSDYDEFDLIAGDFTFDDRRSLIVPVELPSQRRSFLNELERDFLKRSTIAANGRSGWDMPQPSSGDVGRRESGGA